jgi:hypothetical protein
MIKAFLFQHQHVVVGDPDGSFPQDGFSLQTVHFLGNEFLFRKCILQANYVHPTSTPLEKLCVNMRGQVHDCRYIATVEDMIVRVNGMLELFGRDVYAKPFVTVQERGLYVTDDGRRGTLMNFHNTKFTLSPNQIIHRATKWPWKNVALSAYGSPALPLVDVLDRINADLDIFTDPFAAVKRGRYDYYIIRDKRKLGVKPKRKVKVSTPTLNTEVEQ